MSLSRPYHEREESRTRGPAGSGRAGRLGPAGSGRAGRLGPGRPARAGPAGSGPQNLFYTSRWC